MNKQRPPRIIPRFFRYASRTLALGLFVALFACVSQSSVSALTTVPTKVNFQGRLTDASGLIVADGLYNMQFKLYDAASGGTLKWSETRETTNRVQITNGLFSTKLGDVTPMDPAIFASGSLYFEITQATPGTATCSTAACATWESPMSSRTLVAASAYAYNSETLDGLDSASFAQLSANNTWTGTNIYRTTSATAFTIQNAGGAATLLTANTSTMNLTLGSSTSLTLTGGAVRPTGTEGMLWYDTSAQQLLVYANGKWQSDRTTSTKIVAASDSSQAEKDAADYIVTGTAEDEITSAMTAATGGVVYLMKGTYTINSELSPPDGTTLVGSGYETVLQLAEHDTGSGYDPIIASNFGPYNFTVRDIRFEGQKAIQGCTSCTQTAYYSWQTGNSTSQGAKFIHNWFMNFKDNGVHLNNSENNTFIDNTFMNNGNKGIYLGGTNNIIANNTFQANLVGIYMDYSTGAITGNTFRDNTDYNIHLNHSNAVTVSGNSITGGSLGVYLENSSNNTIEGNALDSNTAEGILLETTSNTLVTGNVVANSGGPAANNAIVLNYTSTSNTLTNNAVTDTSCTTTCYAISIIDSGSSTNYLADNTLGSGSINNTGTGTIFAGQVNNSGNFLIQPAGTISLLKAVNITGAITGTSSLTLGTSSSTNGSMVFKNSTNVNTATLLSGATSTSYTLTLPTALGSSGQCLSDTTGAGVLGWANCSGGGVSLSSNNTWTGTNAYQNTSATAFTIQNAGGVATLLTANTSTMNVALGSGASLTLTGSGSRPTGAEGMLYYDTTTKQLLTYANGKWQADRETTTKIVAASNSSQAEKDAADYVATGTGDQTQINSALTAAAGGKVYLAKGTYTISDTINVPNNTTLAGAGSGTVITVPNSSVVHTVITNATGGGSGTGVTLQDLTIDGNSGGGQLFDITGILFTGLGSGAIVGGKVTNVTSTNTQDPALTLTSTVNTTITNSSFGGLAVTITSSSNNNVFSNNIFSAPILSTTSSNNTYIGNSINYGIDFNGCSSNVITENTIQNTSGNGVRFYDNSSNNTLSDNTIQNSATGVYIGQLAGNPAYNTVTNNLIKLNTSYGLVITNGGDSTTISNNVFQDNGGATTNNAIYIDLYASNTMITDNRISDASATTTNFPITLVALSANTYLSGNYFSSGTISDSGTNTVYASQPTTAGGLSQAYRQVNSATAFRIQDGSGVAVLTADTSNKRIVIGTSDANGTTLVLDTKSGTGDPTGVAGAMYYNGGTATDAGFRCYQGGGWQSCFGGLYAAIADSSALTGTTLTAQILNNGYTMPANYCTQGRTINLAAAGVTTTTTAAQPMTFTVTLGATTIATQIPATVTPSVSQTNLAWAIDLNFTCRAAPSATSAVYAQGTLSLQSTAAGAASVYPLATASYTTVNVATNATAVVAVKITYGGTGNAANTIRLKEMVLSSY